MNSRARLPCGLGATGLRVYPGCRGEWWAPLSEIPSSSKPTSQRPNVIQAGSQPAPTRRTMGREINSSTTFLQIPHKLLYRRTFRRELSFISSVESHRSSSWARSGGAEFRLHVLGLLFDEGIGPHPGDLFLLIAHGKSLVAYS